MEKQEEKRVKVVNTRELAELKRVKVNTILRSLCVNGHYYGLKPRKGLNGRHLWEVPVD